jgi:hypothetical protein
VRRTSSSKVDGGEWGRCCTTRRRSDGQRALLAGRSRARSGAFHAASPGTPARATASRREAVSDRRRGGTTGLGPQVAKGRLSFPPELHQEGVQGRRLAAPDRSLQLRADRGVALSLERVENATSNGPLCGRAPPQKRKKPCTPAPPFLVPHQQSVAHDPRRIEEGAAHGSPDELDERTDPCRRRFESQDVSLAFLGRLNAPSVVCARRAQKQGQVPGHPEFRPSESG